MEKDISKRNICGKVCGENIYRRDVSEGDIYEKDIYKEEIHREEICEKDGDTKRQLFCKKNS